MNRRFLATIALLLTAGAWGATFTLIKEVIQQIAPEPFIFWRFTLAGAILCALAAARRTLRRDLLPRGLILGGLVLGGYLSQTHGLALISPSRSALLTGLYVVVVPFLQWRSSGRPRWNAWLASTVALGGTVVLIGGVEGHLSRGDLLTILCAVIFALHVHLSARWSTTATAAPLAAIQILAVGLAAAPLALGAPPTRWNAGIVLVIVFTAVVTTALAFAALMWGQAHVSATEAAVILSFEPVAAAFTSIVFYGEPVTLPFVIGATMIVGAMVVSQLGASNTTMTG